jgi:hypothetical protein
MEPYIDEMKGIFLSIRAEQLRLDCEKKHFRRSKRRIKIYNLTQKIVKVF